MKIIEKINKKQNMENNPSVTIAFIGDSITQGCFEVYFKTQTKLETVFEYNSAFSSKMRDMIAILYPNVQVNIINSGISGDSVRFGLSRLERDVLKFSPDLVVVGYGANDCIQGGKDGVSEYANGLREMFVRIRETGAEIIYLTQGPLCSKVSPHITDERLLPLANGFLKLENEGVMSDYFEAGKQVAKEENIKICDIYSVWKQLEKNGVDTTELLANKLNHPSREFHYYMAIKILEIMFDL